MSNDLHLGCEVIRLRLAQQLINEMYKQKQFRIPIHLAMGHEALAAALAAALGPGDRLLPSHRNLHYNLARGASLPAIVDEFLLRPSGLGGGRFGSMNLVNPAAGIVYTSSILGNNLGVAAGVCLAKKLRGDGLAAVVTGDGAMEEGTFYELLVFLAGRSIPALVIVENNGWSLASTIAERRGPIDIAGLSASLGAGYGRLAGNDVYAYRDACEGFRRRALDERRPVVVEVMLHSLGDWRQVQPAFPEGKYINYHAGPAPTTELSEWPVMKDSDEDPVHVLCGRFDEAVLRREAGRILAQLREQMS